MLISDFKSTKKLNSHPKTYQNIRQANPTIQIMESLNIYNIGSCRHNRYTMLHDKYPRLYSFTMKKSFAW